MARNTKSSKALPSEPGQKIPVWSWTGAVAAADVEPLTKLVCLNIARYLSDAGKGWHISVKQMMADTGLSNGSIATHLKKAEAAKILVIQRTAKPNGQRGVTLYKPRFPDNVELSREPAEMPGDGGDCGSTEPSVRGTPGVAPSASHTPGPRVGGSSRPRARGARQESLQKGSSQKGSFQERGHADARPAPEAHGVVVDAEFIDVKHAKPEQKAKNYSHAPVALKASKTPTPAKATAHRLPDDWMPSEDGWRFAIERLGSTERAREEFAKFRDYWDEQPDSKGKKVRWDGTWRNWVRRAPQYAPRTPTRSARRVDRSQLCI